MGIQKSNINGVISYQPERKSIYTRKQQKEAF